MSKDNSGPAFPCTPEHSVRMNGEGGSGMSLRDYLAAGFASAQATATSADSGFIITDYVYPGGEESVAQKIARISYELADAMLAARSA